MDDVSQFPVGAAVPALSYAAEIPRSRHDKIYTMLLAVLMFFHVLFAILYGTLAWVLNTTSRDRAVLWMFFAWGLCYVLFEAVVLIIRLTAPARRRWVTVALNIVLLTSFPGGTALAIYGLWKVDRRMRAVNR